MNKVNSQCHKTKKIHKALTKKISSNTTLIKKKSLLMEKSSEKKITYSPLFPIFKLFNLILLFFKVIISIIKED